MGNFPNNFMFRSGGSGSSSGGSAGINYVPLIFAGDSLTGINTYNDGASATPTDGTGGVVTGLTTALNTTTPLVGSSSVRFSKDASNRQGEGWSYDFTVDRLSYEASNPLFWQFCVRTSSGYVNGDIRLFVYDKDTGTLLTVQDIANNSGSIVPNPNDGLISCTFYTTASSNDYRLIWHIAGTTAAAWDVDWDNITVSPQTTQPGFFGTYLGALTTTGSWSTNTTYVGNYWRRGNTLRGMVTVSTSGAPTAAALTLNLPGTLAIDTAALSQSSANLTVVHSSGGVIDSGARNGSVNAAYASTTSLQLLYTLGATTNAGITQLAPMTFGAGDSVTVTYEVPISGWAESAALSTTEAMFSTAKAAYTSAAGQSIPNNTVTIVDFGTKEYDNLTCVTTGASWKFTAPRSNWYFGSTRVEFVDSAAWAIGEAAQLFLNKNGSTFRVLEYWEAEAANTIIASLAGSFGLYLNKGDTIDVRVQQLSGGALALFAGAIQNYVTIAEDPDFAIFSVYGQTEYLSTTSSVKTPTASDRYHQLTGNSLTLTPGTWRLTGSVQFSTSGGAATYSNLQCGWFGANGADTNVAPAALSTVATVISSDLTLTFYSTGFGDASSWPVKQALVRVTAPTTVYLVSYALMTTAANARVTVYANAERLQ